LKLSEGYLFKHGRPPFGTGSPGTVISIPVTHTDTPVTFFIHTRFRNSIQSASFIIYEKEQQSTTPKDQAERERLRFKAGVNNNVDHLQTYWAIKH
jgi:hypothetical protein